MSIIRAGVRAIAQEAAATTFEVLLSALHVVLRRYGNDEVAVAIDVTPR